MKLRYTAASGREYGLTCHRYSRWHNRRVGVFRALRDFFWWRWTVTIGSVPIEKGAENLLFLRKALKRRLVSIAEGREAERDSSGFGAVGKNDTPKPLAPQRF